MRDERTNKKTTSIARKINARFWFRRFFSFLGIDVLIVLFLIGTCMVWRLDTVNPDWWEYRSDICFYFDGQTYDSFTMKTCVLEQQDVFFLHEFFDYTLIPLAILGGVEFIMLVSAFFSTRMIRRKLKPLNDLAVRAEA